MKDVDKSAIYNMPKALESASENMQSFREKIEAIADRKEPVTYEQVIDSITAYSPVDGQQDYFDVGCNLPKSVFIGQIERLKKLEGQKL